MKKLKAFWRTGRSIGVILLAAGLIAACSSGADDTDLEKGKKVLRLSFGAAVQSIDPVYIFGTWEKNQVASLFDTLTAHNLSGRLVPSLASSWKVSNNGKTYTFYLRPNAKFSDGVKLTADDVRFSWQRLIDPKTGSSYAFLAEGIKNGSAIVHGKKPVSSFGVKVVDAHTVRVDLEKPIPYFPELIANEVMAIVPEHVVKKFGKKWTRPGNIVSSGAYKLVNFVPKGNITMARNENFWDNAHVDVDKLVYKVINDSTAMVRYFKAGGFDFIYNVDPATAASYIKEDKEKTITYPSLTSWFVTINAKSPLLKNINIRKAMSFAIDRETFVKNVKKGMEVPAWGLVPPGISGYVQAKAKGFKGTAYAQRLVRAKKLMEDAGYSDKNPLKISFYSMSSGAAKKAAVAVISFWKEIHIQTELIRQDPSAFYAGLSGGKQQVSFSGWAGDYNDAMTFLEFLRPSSSASYIHDTDDKEYEQLLEQSFNVSSKQKRMAVLKKAEQHLLDRYFLLPLTFGTKTILIDKKVVTNFTPNTAADYRIRFFKISRK